jgi:hypothetical protein
MTVAALLVGLTGMRVPSDVGSEVRRLHIAPGGADAGADPAPARGATPTDDRLSPRAAE